LGATKTSIWQSSVCPDHIDLDIQVTKTDYVRAARRRFWRSLAVVVALAPLAVTIPLWRSSTMRQEILSGDLRAIAVILGLYGAVALFLALSVEICARSFGQVAARKAATALKPQKLRFSDSGMAWAVNGSAGAIPWTAFRKASKARWAILLHLSGGRDVVIPLRQVPANVKPDLETMIKAHLDKRAGFR
jgi:hypothetical protein